MKKTKYNNLTINDLYKDAWTCVAGFFSTPEEFFNVTLLNKSIRNEILEESPYVVPCYNIEFVIKDRKVTLKDKLFIITLKYHRF